MAIYHFQSFEGKQYRTERRTTCSAACRAPNLTWPISSIKIARSSCCVLRLANAARSRPCNHSGLRLGDATRSFSTYLPAHCACRPKGVACNLRCAPSRLEAGPTVSLFLTPQQVLLRGIAAAHEPSLSRLVRFQQQECLAVSMRGIRTAWAVFWHLSTSKVCNESFRYMASSCTSRFVNQTLLLFSTFRYQTTVRAGMVSSLGHDLHRGR